VPRTTIVDLSPPEQAHMLAEVRRARYGYLLALQILLLCAAQRSPTEIATVLFCSRSTVYRVGRAYRAGELEGIVEEGAASPLARRPVLGPALKRSVLAILHAVPRACGWLSHPVELRDGRPGTPGPAGGRGIGRDGAPRAACPGLGVEAGQARGQG
jgi:hypothetical protein